MLMNQPVVLESNAVFMGIEYLAIFCCGLSGGLAAVKKQYDLFAILVAAWMTALGGGIIRDTLLGALPPVGIADKGLVLTTLMSGIVVAVAHPEIEHLRWSMIVTDAMGLGLFAVNGTAKSLAYGMSGMVSVFLGMFTALAGGLIRDMILSEVPAVIRDKHWYAVPSFVGCILTVCVYRSVVHWSWGLDVEMALDVAIVVLVVALRVLSVRFDITLPGAVRRDIPKSE
ncbi:trimeric intracellular cation channel family protein [Bifidobacterium primatium]